MTATAERFVLPPHSEADAPPEYRGLTRDGVRLLVARPGEIRHRRFAALEHHLEPGDLLVVNTSATLPAALDAWRSDGRPAALHISTELDDGTWVVEPRRPDGPARDVAAGEVFRLPGDVALQLIEPYPEVAAALTRLWRARATPPRSTVEHLSRYGRPVSYSYLTGSYPLADYQNVYARVPGSAEMASAGRPFTERLLVRLMARGVAIAPIVLHAGVSSAEKYEPPMPERFEVPEGTARLVNATSAAGARVVAVGTTVVRALESAAGRDGQVAAVAGWTNLVLGPYRPTRVVTGLISGLHPPEASHLMLLDAVAGAELVDAAYRAAVRRRYRWHEFGDSSLFLPDLYRGAGSASGT
jgi:S-adenosylmethionine:tRNA ribosyltransferase-isomerase